MTCPICWNKLEPEMRLTCTTTDPMDCEVWEAVVDCEVCGFSHKLPITLSDSDDDYKEYDYAY